jgi:excisionase family DNA binding protein
VRRWHSVTEVAQMLGLAPMTVYRAIHAGQLPAMKLGRRYLIPARALDAMEEVATASRGEGNDDNVPEAGASNEVRGQ